MGMNACGAMAIAATMKKVSSTMSITGFFSSDLGFRRTTESTSTFLEKTVRIPVGADSLLVGEFTGFSLINIHSPIL